MKEFAFPVNQDMSSTVITNAIIRELKDSELYSPHLLFACCNHDSYKKLSKFYAEKDLNKVVNKAMEDGKIILAYDSSVIEPIDSQNHYRLKDGGKPLAVIYLRSDVIDRMFRDLESLPDSFFF